MNIKGFWNKHIGSSSDWKAENSAVNRVRRQGLSKPAVGAGIGAAVGGTAGFAWGMHNLSQDHVTIESSTKPLTRPVLIGADYDPPNSYTTVTTDADGNMQVQWHHDPATWRPIVSHVDTGQTEQREVFRHSGGFGPLTGTLVGMGAGALVGALVTSLTGLISDEQPKRWDRPKVPTTEREQSLAKMADRAPLVGTLTGATVGAAAGAWAGSVSAARNLQIDQVVASPVYEWQTIGHIPRVSQKGQIPRELFHPGQKIYYHELPEGRWGTPPFSEGGTAVNRRVFTGEYQEVRSIENSHWLNPARGMILGAGLGAVAGLASGVAGGILMKIASGEQPPKL